MCLYTIVRFCLFLLTTTTTKHLYILEIKIFTSIFLRFINYIIISGGGSDINTIIAHSCIYNYTWFNYIIFTHFNTVRFCFIGTTIFVVQQFLYICEWRHIRKKKDLTKDLKKHKPQPNIILFNEMNIAQSLQCYRNIY